MELLKNELNRKVTLDNLCSPEIIRLSQELDKKVVVAQKSLSPL
ncbi:aspartyl-phosphate phosphatase Spo0E family protein [Clostridium gasigenes]|uniref:Aspartyl-phosphate phosphatase Spo0E family protein n=1 Tax=Clostridium gasigenes TaxID=94869 RepID=A0A7X0SF06_9CLOT|nr:aspartyl-phosphate phosphatase Spo0E family protein [Clostridium gasigenes]MBB6716335.1 aspartyl-phosphate phosphatase Spo0E family protein [Clostridium gasigenes]